MRVRFQADADLDVRTIRGLKRRQPDIDIETAAEAELTGVPDTDVLRRAADSDRILVTHDRRTMPAHFRRFTARRTSPGIIIVSRNTSLAAAIEELLLIWAASEPEEWRNRLLFIPL